MPLAELTNNKDNHTNNKDNHNKYKDNHNYKESKEAPLDVPRRKKRRRDRKQPIAWYGVW